jgi:hypothetical protein
MPSPEASLPQPSATVKKERQKSKLYETFQKVRRNTFTPTKEEDEGSSLKSPPLSSTGTIPKTKPRLLSKGSISGIPMVLVNSPSPTTTDAFQEKELCDISRAVSMDSINDLQEMPSQMIRHPALNAASEIDMVFGTPILRPSTRTNFAKRFPEIEDALLQCK